MFTGLVQKIATVTSCSNEDFGLRLVISCRECSEPIELGESICIAGCCLSVVENMIENGKNLISFDVVPESLTRTTLGTIAIESVVNMERSLRASSLLGGHFVQGHVDGIESILDCNSQDKENPRLRVSMQSIDRDTIISKGSIAIDGVSLTISSVGASGDEDWFEVALVPTTLRETTLAHLTRGDSVNIETDILARTVVQVVKNMQQ